MPNPSDTQASGGKPLQGGKGENSETHQLNGGISAGGRGKNSVPCPQIDLYGRHGPYHSMNQFGPTDPEIKGARGRDELRATEAAPQKAPPRPPRARLKSACRSAGAAFLNREPVKSRCGDNSCSFTVSLAASCVSCKVRCL